MNQTDLPSPRSPSSPYPLLLLIFAVGCWNGSETEDATAPPFADQTLNVAMPAALGFRDRWDIILDEWSAQTGARPHLLEYDVRENRRALIELLKPSQSGTQAVPENPAAAPGRAGESGDPPALSVFPIARIPELAAENVLASIPDDQRAADRLNWIDVFRGLREHVASVEGQPTVVPLSCPVLVCYYRRDLLEQAGLAPPDTWDDYQQLLDTLDRWAPGMTAVEPWGDDYRATMFLARAVSYAKHPGNYSFFFDISSGEPLIDRPGFVRALEAARSALAQMPEAVKEYTPADCRRDFFLGRAALAVTFETGPGNPPLPFGPSERSNPPRPVTVTGRGDVTRPSLVAGFCRLPGQREVYNHSTESWESPPGASVNRVTLTGFTGLCAGVSRTSSPLQQQAAWNLLTTLAVENLTIVFPAATKGPCRRSQVTRPSAWVGEELSAGEGAEYLHAVAESLGDSQLVAELPVVGRDRFRTALTAGVSTVLSGSAQPQQALAEVAHRWQQITEEVGLEAVLDSYRRSLGLPPLMRPAPLSQPP